MNPKCRLPLVDVITKHIDTNATRYDTPGHKAGRGLPDVTRRLLALGGAADMTLPDEAAAWSFGCVAEAEQLAARLWGAKRSFFSYNGTTAAIQAMLLATLNPGDKVIIAENCHRSVLHGLVLCGAQPVFLPTCYRGDLQLDLNVSAVLFGRLLKKNPDCKAVIVTNPTYYGIGCDLRLIVKIAHDRGLLVLVDEAHGAHWRFSAQLPDDAVACGADIVAQSTHKMLNSLSQTSMLHVNSAAVDCGKVARAMRLLQSSSPNYLLVASLDAARADMEDCGAEKVRHSLELSRYIRSNIAALPLMCYNNNLIREIGGGCLDESKLIIDFSRGGYSGSMIQEQLMALKIVPEMCDSRNVLFHITIGDDQRSAGILINGLQKIFNEPGGQLPVSCCCAPPPLLCAVTPREAFFAHSEYVDMQDACNRVSARTECFYPPGIPFVAPGTVISAVTLEYVATMEAAGFYAAGHEGKIKQLEVLVL